MAPPANLPELFSRLSPGYTTWLDTPPPESDQARPTEKAPVEIGPRL
jgi:hypothetical protein